MEAWRHRLARSQSRLPAQALALFAENPFWTAKRLAERLEVAFTSAQRAIERLEEDGIVILASPGKRNRVYCARAILDILEEPASLGGRKPGRGRRGK